MKETEENGPRSGTIKKVALALLLFGLVAVTAKFGGFAGILIVFVFPYLFFQLITR